MKPSELIKLCDECIKRFDQHPEYNLSETGPVIPLVLPWQSSGYSVKLFKTSGPIGKIANVTERSTLAYFDPHKVKKAIIKSLREIA